VRICKFKMDNVEFDIAPMTWAQSEKYQEQGRELVRREKEGTDKPKPNEWLERAAQVIVDSLNRVHSEEKYTVDRVKEEMDLALIEYLYREILKISGLGIVGDESAGGAPAASTSRASAAA
jgi:hypothetical protein